VLTQRHSSRAEVAKKMARYCLEVKKPIVDCPYVEEKGKDIDSTTFDIATSTLNYPPKRKDV